MKNKKYLFMLVVITAIFFSSCNQKTEPLHSGTSSGTSLQDTVLPKMLFKLVHEGGANYFAYYWVNAVQVDTTKHPTTITLPAQSAYYDATNNSFVLHNGTSSSQISSTVSLNTDTVNALVAGPFDVVNGQLYSVKGYLHYIFPKTAGGADSCVCAIATIVYYNQNGPGSPMTIGYLTQDDLHAPKPPSHP